LSAADGQSTRPGRTREASTAATAAGIFALVDDRLRAVEETFERNLASPVRLIAEIGEFVAEGGGKRVRPALHLLCASLCGYEGPHDVLMATVLEFIHSATLIHDDIIDEATTRRGRTSVNHRFGNNVTVLFGDHMLAKAMEMALDAGSLRIMRKLAEVTLRMTEGEMLQTRYVGRLDLTVEQHLDLIERKTAVLFAGCCEIAGMLADVDADQEARLRRYGLNLGLAFQVVDDLLDFTGDPKTLGKPSASDLREGKVTLALIDLLASGSPRARDLALGILEDGTPDSPEIPELTALLEQSGAIERAREAARRFASEAAAVLGTFPPGQARDALEALPGILVSRDR
jgi:octaprenyl-diphosphate synthase